MVNLKLCKKHDYNFIKAEFARRTHDESGDYYIQPFGLSIRNTLNNYLGNDGLYNEGELTYQANTPSDNLMEYVILLVRHTLEDLK